MKYVADDGTQFDTEAECRKYEAHLDSVQGSFIMYGDDLRLVSTWNECYYIDILDNYKDVAQYFSDVLGIVLDDGVIRCNGLYMYDENDARTKYIPDVIEYHAMKYRDLVQLKTKLEELRKKEGQNNDD